MILRIEETYIYLGAIPTPTRTTRQEQRGLFSERFYAHVLGISVIGFKLFLKRIGVEFESAEVFLFAKCGYISIWKAIITTIHSAFASASPYIVREMNQNFAY